MKDIKVWLAIGAFVASIYFIFEINISSFNLWSLKIQVAIYARQLPSNNLTSKEYAAFKSIVLSKGTPTEFRAMRSTLKYYYLPALHDVKFTRAEFEYSDPYNPNVRIKCAAEWFAHKDTAFDAPVIFYIHGGGWVFGGGLNLHRRAASEMSRRTKMRVFVPDYRVVPEVSVRKSLDDIMGAYAWLGRGHKDIAVVAESIGVGILPLLLRMAEARHLSFPSAAVVISPWAQININSMAPPEATAGSNHKKEPNYDPDPLWSQHLVNHVKALVVAASNDGLKWPILGSGDGGQPLRYLAYDEAELSVHLWPPTLFQVMTNEVLHAQGQRMFEQLAAAGAEATFSSQAVGPHMSHLFFDLYPEADAAMDEVCTYLRKAMAAPQRGRRQSDTYQRPRGAGSNERDGRTAASIAVATTSTSSASSPLLSSMSEL